MLFRSEGAGGPDRWTGIGAFDVGARGSPAGGGGIRRTGIGGGSVGEHGTTVTPFGQPEIRGAEERLQPESVEGSAGHRPDRQAADQASFGAGEATCWYRLGLSHVRRTVPDVAIFSNTLWMAPALRPSSM